MPRRQVSSRRRRLGAHDVP
uniref:Uncharacterized protein n=1 Tax=Arundo donax TaxID=35708 RepID=A0A0A9C2T0_ARUDO